jgi:hypothetical protein
MSGADPQKARPTLVPLSIKLFALAAFGLGRRKLLTGSDPSALRGPFAMVESSERNELELTVTLPEGSHELCDDVELLQQEDTPPVL